MSSLFPSIPPAASCGAWARRGFWRCSGECAGIRRITVNREYYLNDRGVQIDRLGESVTRRYMELQGVHMPYPEECYQGDYIIELAKRLIFRM